MRKSIAAIAGASTLFAGAIGIAWADSDGKSQRLRVRNAQFTTLPAAGDAYDGVKGKAKLVIDKVDGETSVRVDLRGLVPSATYPAHLHVGNCSDDVGGHYVHAEGGLELPYNELWPEVVVDGAGRGIGEDDRGWVADDAEGLTVVVHDHVTGDKVLCAEF